ncbi:Hint domain-containing protein [Roseovarius autotrophicus]|uniref:Hint domain-containing protein n=1 Tax=Roseovarius autotrophicus TaxID=2824121 RepID=UPI0019DF0BF5|nr:Hint domain-containing protein [Roseovarius autotrophicus]MBE0452190.1 Hint domain-containing protein [Roseovarius sp.]
MKPDTVGRPGGGSAVLDPLQEAGLWTGGIILTLDGERRTEDLRAGDRIVTRDAGMAVLRGIVRRRARAALVRIRAGSLGHTRPERDVILPAGQPILVRDWRARALFGADHAIVPAARLVDGEFVTLTGLAEVDLWRLDFDRPHILYLDGLEVASAAR